MKPVEFCRALDLGEDDIIYTWAGVRPLGFDARYPKGKRSVELHELSKQNLPGVYAMTAGPIMTHRKAGRDVVEAIRKILPASRRPDPPNYAPQTLPDNPNSPLLLNNDPCIRLSDLAYAATDEHALSLKDILIARTGLVYRHRLTDDEIRRAAEAVSVHLGWTQDEMECQIMAFHQTLDDTYQMERRA